MEDLWRARDQILEDMRADPETLQIATDQLRHRLEQTVAQGHDFMQLVKLVKGYSQTLLQQKFPDLPAQDAAERLESEGAIYFSTELMLMKMDSLAYMNNPTQAAFGATRFEIHPYLLKHVRIYNWLAKQRELRIRIEGECYARCMYSPKAVGAIFQGLLDNLVKYSPAGCNALIRFVERSRDVLVSFHSLGPQIKEDEMEKIFLPSYRAEAARSMISDGMGIGLASAKNVSDTLGLDLSVSQSSESDPTHVGMYATEFRVTLDKDHRLDGQGGR